MTTALAPIRICSADDPEWLERRMEGISASECAAACGVSEWSTPLEVYARKRGKLGPIEETLPMRFGKFAEPFIAAEFERSHGLTIADHNPGLYRHAEYPWILATPDRIIDDATLLEIKTINEWRAKEVLGELSTDEVPWEWNCQCQQQMLVMEAQAVFLAVLVGGQDLRIFEVQRNDKAIVGIQKRLTELWLCIKAGTPPVQREHKTLPRLVRELFGEVETGSIVDLSDDAAAAWSGYEARKDTINLLEKEAEQLKAKVLLELAKSEAGRLPDGRYVRRKLVKRAGYTVEPKEYIDTRAVSAKTYDA